MMDFTLSSFLMVAARTSSLVTQWERILLQCRRHERCGFDPWVGWEDPLEEEMAPHSSILA